MRPSARATEPGVPGAKVTAPATRPAGLAPSPAAGVVLPGARPDAGAGVIAGKRPAALPAPMTVVLVRVRPGLSPGMTAFPGPISVLVALLGKGPGSCIAPPLDVPTGLADPVCEALAEGLGDADRVGLALGLELPDAEPVGLALGVEVGDVDPVGLGVDVGVGDVEGVGLALPVAVGDAEGVGVALAVGVAVDVDGDGLGVLEAESELVLATAEEDEGEGVTTLASAGSCLPADSPGTSKLPMTSPTTTAPRCPRDIWTPPVSAACTGLCVKI
jgi:hypothetical protein